MLWERCVPECRSSAQDKTKVRSNKRILRRGRFLSRWIGWMHHRVLSAVRVRRRGVHRVVDLALEGPLLLRLRLPSLLALSVPRKERSSLNLTSCGVWRRCFSSNKASKKGDGTSSRSGQEGAGAAATTTRHRRDALTGKDRRLRSSRGQENRSFDKSSQSISPRSRLDAPSSPPTPNSVSSPSLNVIPSILQGFGGGGSEHRGRRRSWTIEHAKAAALRLPLWMSAVFVALLCDETSPVSVISVVGPSMIPTMAPDGTDAWLVLRYPRFWQPEPVVKPRLGVGDLVGVQVPFHIPHRGDDEVNQTEERSTRRRGGGGGGAVVSCKRVVGVEGDVVKRYGQFVHLFVAQDPTGYGVVWPGRNDDDDDGPNSSVLEHHRHLDPSCPWDGGRDMLPKDPHRTLVVPPGHVWVEGDCPGLAVDSRHYGPVPLGAVRGKVVARLWPLVADRPEMNHRHYRRRPHPTPLDDDTLRQYNVHRLQKPLPVAVSGGA